MNELTLEKKMELIAGIRSECDRNRQSLKNCESILYERGNETVQKKEDVVLEEPSATSSFSLRLVLAIILFVVFLIADQNQFSYRGWDTNRIMECFRQMPKENAQAISDFFTPVTDFLTPVIDFINQIPYTF